MNNIDMKALSEKTSCAMNERHAIDTLLREVGQLTARVTALEKAATQHDSKPSPSLMNQAQRAWFTIHFPYLSANLADETFDDIAHRIEEEISFQRRHSEKIYPRQRKWLEAAGFEIPATAVLASKRIMHILEKRHEQKILRGS